ncbi:MAG: septation protein SepH [Acidimicrobiales bacterium]
MQHLHLVGFTSDHDGLIFSTRRGSKSGGFVATLDDDLLALVREAVRLQSGMDLDFDQERADARDSRARERRRAGRVHSELNPKEIQARLRAGRSVQDVADEAGVDEDWVLRFAAPVLAEQSRVLAQALQAPCRANRKGESAEPLAESVALNMIDRGAPMTDDELAGGWSAYHVRDGSWVVRFRYVSRRRDQVAQWAFDLSDRDLVPLNRLASELGYVEPGRRKRKPTLLEVVHADERRPASRADSGPSPSADVPQLRHIRGVGAPLGPARAGGVKSTGAKPAAAAKVAKKATKKAPKKAAKKVVKKVAKKVVKKAAKVTKKVAKKAVRQAAAKPAGRKAAPKRAPAKKAAKAPARKATATRKAPIRKATATRKAPAKKAPAARHVAPTPVLEASPPRRRPPVGVRPREARRVQARPPAPFSLAEPPAVGVARRPRPLVAVRRSRPPVEARALRPVGAVAEVDDESMAPGLTIQADRAGQAPNG